MLVRKGLLCPITHIQAAAILHTGDIQVQGPPRNSVMTNTATLSPGVKPQSAAPVKN